MNFSEVLFWYEPRLNLEFCGATDVDRRLDERGTKVYCDGK